MATIPPKATDQRGNLPPPGGPCPQHWRCTLPQSRPEGCAPSAQEGQHRSNSPSWTPAVVLCATPFAKAIRTPPGIEPASARKAPCQLTILSRTLLSADPSIPARQASWHLGCNLSEAQRGAPAELSLALLCPRAGAEAGAGPNPAHDHPGSGRGMVPHRKKERRATSLTGSNLSRST